MLGQLSGYIRSMHDEFLTKSSSSSNLMKGQPTDVAQLAVIEHQAPPTGKNMPVVVTNIVWSKQLESKVCDTLSVAEALLGGLTGFDAFQQEATDLKAVLKEYQKDQFGSWCKELTSAIAHKSDTIRYVQMCSVTV